MMADGWSFLYNVLNAILRALFPLASQQMKLLWKCCRKIGSLFITCWVSVAVKKWSIYGKSVLRVADARNNQFHYNLQRKSLLECATVRCFMGGSYYGSPYRLDILTRILRRIFKQNLCSLCDPWILVAYGKKSLGEIFFKMLLTQEMKFLWNIIFNYNLWL